MPEIGHKVNQVEFFGDPHTSLMMKETDRGHNIITVGGQSIDSEH